VNNDYYIMLDQVTYSYPSGGFHLNAGNLGLSSGRITFFCGENGSGKTTLGKLISGIYKPDFGSVRITGIETTRLTLGEIGRMVGYLWQNCEQQLFARTVLEELLFVRRLKRMGASKSPNLSVMLHQQNAHLPRVNSADDEDAEERAMDWLRYFGIDKYAQSSSIRLSKGEKQRLALAAVLDAGAGYLILDEPTTGLDDGNKQILTDLLAKLREVDNIGMAIISHDSAFTRSLAERIVTLAAGEVISDENIN